VCLGASTLRICAVNQVNSQPRNLTVLARFSRSTYCGALRSLRGACGVCGVLTRLENGKIVETLPVAETRSRSWR
jgi:hypothetical protein